MSPDATRVRQCLQGFDFRALFIQELGWDRHTAHLLVTVDGRTYSLHCVAEKRGFQVFECPANASSSVPDHATRSKIERQVGKFAHEHIIIYVDENKSIQKWQWVRRELGRPLARREYEFSRGQTGEVLVQKLQSLAVDLSEEENLTLVDVTRRARQVFDVDRITKRFYDRFKAEHATFLTFMKGITVVSDSEWYASLMLNRLMFIYFIQKKGFLDGDPNYLRNRLEVVQQRKGKDKFLSFYRYFLVRLFHEGLGQPPTLRKDDLEAVLGNVPYLNGGLFDVHELEKAYPDIQIVDEAFERLFDFFDAYQWHLDERPLRADNEINPDVLGYIFEKYINQKQMGAYYTKEDITEYIGQNSVLPFIFDDARAKCKVAFENPGGPTVWDLLRQTPDRYIYPAILHGADKPLPPEIAAGVKMASKRTHWNKSASDDYGLATEIWREVVARRTRYEEVRQQLTTSELRDTNDLVTLNLDIRQFMQDAIENCEGPELLRAFWHAVQRVTILDPTCGSGAFLFAALNILEPLYEACLDRMEAFVTDLDRSGEKQRPERFSDFRSVLDRVAGHSNRRYFILKTIILNNLFGVDLMQEAVEICKLRLFLKLAAQVEPDTTKENIGIEPLPDIDFNIRAGNTLVGYATYEDVKRVVTSKLDFDNVAEKIATKAADLQQTFDAFRQHQTEGNGSATTERKSELRERLKSLRDELDRYLAGEYGVETRNKTAYARWVDSHQPFHWFVEFYGILSDGGFDVIIGNPPYVELSKINTQYRPLNFVTEPCGNLYALCVERSFTLQHQASRFGFIVQQPITSTIRMASCRELLLNNSSFVWCSTYDDRPSKLFDGMHHARLAIILAKRNDADAPPAVLSVTAYNKWFKEERENVFHRLAFVATSGVMLPSVFPKISTDTEIAIIKKLLRCTDTLGGWLSNSGSAYKLFYKITGVGRWFTITPRPPKFLRHGKQSSSSRESEMTFASESVRDRAFCVLNSTLFYWFYQVRTNCRDFNPSDYKMFPVPKSLNGEEMSKTACKLKRLLDDSAEMVAVSHNITGAIKYEKFRPRMAKSIIDEIDGVLARHYGFTDDELDFIINYDVKYRMGQDAEDEAVE